MNTLEWVANFFPLEAAPFSLAACSSAFPASAGRAIAADSPSGELPQEP